MTMSVMGDGATHGRDASLSVPRGYGTDLPQIDFSAAPSASASLHARLSRAEHLLRGRRRNVNGCLSATNWCSGFKHSRGGGLHGGPAFGEALIIQAEVDARVGAAVGDFSDYNAIPKQQDAFQAFLRGRSVFDPYSAG